jgi:hypothetical protein
MVQTYLPDKIVLYLCRGEFENTTLPDTLIRLLNYGLTIRYVDDNIRSYLKLIPALREYPDDVIVTYDDDIYYPSRSLERLVTSFQKDPTVVHTNRARLVAIDRSGRLKSWHVGRWYLYHGGKRSPLASSLVFSEGVSGTLYPPHILHGDVSNATLFGNLAPLHDDLWFWAMTVVNGKAALLVENSLGALNITGRDESRRLCDLNIGNGMAKEQNLRVFEYYQLLPRLRGDRRRHRALYS